MTPHWRAYLPADAADWVQLAVLVIAVYALLRLVRGTIAASILRGTFILVSLAVIIAAFVLSKFELRVLQAILSALLSTMVVALLIVFQPEMRRALLSLGQHRLLGRFRPSPRGAIDVVTQTVARLARERRGALIAIERGSALQHIVSTGTRLDAQATHELLYGIFWPGAPLHDGGVVIRGDRIVAAGCIFPLAERTDLESSLGTRHRAGIGISEESDAVAVIVSEETGRVSVAVNGGLRFVDPETELLALLEQLTGVSRARGGYGRRKEDAAPAADEKAVA